MKNKTHWLQSPNKNYLGHWDLPENEDLVLTIESAKWEEVKNPITNKSEAKRVVRFKENYKPFICNQTNAQSIINATGVKYMEDTKGCRIQLYVGQHNDRRTKENVDCVRIRRELKMSGKDILLSIQRLYTEKESLLSEKEKEYIKRILDNEETISYDKCYNFLKNKTNG